MTNKTVDELVKEFLEDHEFPDVLGEHPAVLSEDIRAFIPKLREAVLIEAASNLCCISGGFIKITHLDLVEYAKQKGIGDDR